MRNLIDELQLLQKETIEIVSAVSDKNYHHQFHADLSPIGWHLGHCVYTESYWIREQLLNFESIDETLKSLYVPELSTKKLRGYSLANKADLLDWAKLTQSENIGLLESYSGNSTKHHLLENNYLLHFLIQHYAQHIETMQLVLTEIQIKKFKNDIVLEKILTPRKQQEKTVSIKTGRYNIGSNEKNDYDNERPTHTIELNKYKISTRPVSNAEYLFFIKDGAYLEKKHWSKSGWEWVCKYQFNTPHHWRIQHDGNYYGVNHDGPYALEENHPVHGLSYYEVEAYANWIGARLPNEYEWEVAAKENHLEQTSLVWEWCSNTFHPYKEFSAYPYEGYSVPYFDEKHYVLRGGSRFTKKQINRISFRNYYNADKRHIVAGMRLVF